MDTDKHSNQDIISEHRDDDGTCTKSAPAPRQKFGPNLPHFRGNHCPAVRCRLSSR